jgi:hypothetical protein
MELQEIQTIISKAIEQIKPDQVVPLINWLDGELSRYRMESFSKCFSFQKNEQDLI